MNQGRVFLVRPRLLIAEGRASYPLNLVAVFSSLRNLNINTRIVDIDALCRQGAVFASVCDELLAELFPVKYPIVGISANDANLPETLYLAGRIKKQNKNCKIILGGPGVYFNSDAIISKFGHLVDYIVRGEADRTFFALVSGILKGQEGAYADRVIDSPRITRMDGYAFPQYDKLDPLNYSSRLGVEYVPVLVGAGCRHQCRYCSTSNFWGHAVRYKSVERVVKEIVFLKSIGISRIDLVHDNLFTDMAYVTRLSTVLSREMPLISWSCSGRADDFDISAAPLMAKAGCRSIFWGIESGSEDGLRIINKNILLGPSIKKIYEVSGKYGIESKVSFIYNFPGDTYKYFKETLELAFRLKSENPDRMQIALNSFLALSGAIFTRSTPLAGSKYLLRQIDFDPGFRKTVAENPEIFPFYLKPKNITTLNEPFRHLSLNLIFNSFPKTIQLLHGEYSLIEILRNLQRKGNIGRGVRAMGGKAANIPMRLLSDIFQFEYLSAVPPTNAAQGKTYRLLETAFDPLGPLAKPVRKKNRYLFFYHEDRIDTFELTAGNFKRFRRAAQSGAKGKKEAISEMEKYL